MSPVEYYIHYLLLDSSTDNFPEFTQDLFIRYRRAGNINIYQIEGQKYLGDRRQIVVQ